MLQAVKEIQRASFKIGYQGPQENKQNLRWPGLCFNIVCDYLIDGQRDAICGKFL